MSRPDPWRRDRGAPFDDLSREQFAQARAKGVGILASANAADISNGTASAFERHPEMQARVRELRAGAETFVGVSVPQVINELMKNAEEARGEKGGYRDSNNALWMVYKILSEDRDVAAAMLRRLGPDVSRRNLQKRLSEEFNGRMPPPAQPIDVPPEPMEASDGEA